MNSRQQNQYPEVEALQSFAAQNPAQYAVRVKRAKAAHLMTTILPTPERPARLRDRVALTARKLGQLSSRPVVRSAVLDFYDIKVREDQNSATEGKHEVYAQRKRVFLERYTSPRRSEIWLKEQDITFGNTHSLINLRQPKPHIESHILGKFKDFDVVQAPDCSPLEYEEIHPVDEQEERIDKIVTYLDALAHPDDPSRLSPCSVNEPTVPFIPG